MDWMQRASLSILGRHVATNPEPWSFPRQPEPSHGDNVRIAMGKGQNECLGIEALSLLPCRRRPMFYSLITGNVTVST